MNKYRTLFVFTLGLFLFSLIFSGTGSAYFNNGWAPYGCAPYGPNIVPNFPNYPASAFYTNPAVAYNPAAQRYPFSYGNNFSTTPLSSSSSPTVTYIGGFVPMTSYNAGLAATGGTAKTITQADNGKTLTFHVGDSVKIILSSDYTLSEPNPPAPVPGMTWSSAWDPVQTGSQWKEDFDLLDDSVFRPVTTSYDGNNQTWIYNAVKAGETQMVLTKGTATFSVNITVE